MEGNQILEKKKLINALESKGLFDENEMMLKILNYLVEAEEKKIKVSSSTIAADLFDNESGDMYDSKGAMIRVNIHRLRSKLMEYYANEGKNDSYQISISKRTYGVNIHQNKALENKKSPSKSNRSLYIYKGVCLALLLLVIYFFYEKKMPAKDVDLSTVPKVYHELIEQTDDYKIVLSDIKPHMEYDHELKRYRIINELDSLLVNDAPSFEGFRQKYPQRKMKKAFSPYVRKSDLLLADFLKMELDIHPSTLYASQLNLDVINSYNLIYIAQMAYPTYMLKHYFRLGKLRFSFEELDQSPELFRTHVFVHDENGRNYFEKKEEDDFFFIISRLPSGNDKQILMILYDNLRFPTYLKKHLTSTYFWSVLTKQFDGALPPYFEAVVSVSNMHAKNGFTIQWVGKIKEY